MKHIFASKLQHAFNPPNRWWEISQKATHFSNKGKIHFWALPKSIFFIPISIQNNYSEKKVLQNLVVSCSSVFESHHIISCKQVGRYVLFRLAVTITHSSSNQVLIHHKYNIGIYVVNKLNIYNKTTTPTFVCSCILQLDTPFN